MPINKDDIQDDYYAKVTQSQAADDGSKKPVKLKLKVVAKKSSEEVSDAEDSGTQTVPSA